MPRAEEGSGPLDQVMALIPAEIKESWAKFMAIERERQAAFDLMPSPQLKELAKASLTATAATLSSAALTSSLRARWDPSI